MTIQVFNRLKNLSWLLILTVVASLYVFPVGFRGLPESLNSKQMLGVIGILSFGIRCLRERTIRIPRTILISCMMACLFSLWCLFCCVYNGTSDYAYATYVRSFFIWLGGAYAVCSIIRYVYGYVDLEIVTRYFVLACVAQCAFVLLVDNSPSFMHFVDTFFIQDTTPKQVKRLYGIGCSLDNGGVRMCMALILTAHQLIHNVEVTDNRLLLRFYIISFMIISVIGNMVSRTTTVGLLLGIGYISLTLGLSKRGFMSARQLRFWRVFLFLIVITVVVGMAFYSTSPEVRADIRFAFEAFFNYVEHGELTTGSTDVLMSRMWIWPHDDYAWVVGYGLFEWAYFYSLGMQTDIGYCRFTLYCGLIGLVLFSMYFIYNATVVRRKFRDSGLFALILVALTFIIWVKVSTDIFQLYALLFCLPGDVEDSEDMMICEE